MKSSAAKAAAHWQKDRLVFGPLLLLLFLMPLPWGSNNETSMALFSAGFSSLLLLWLVLYVFNATSIKQRTWPASLWLSLLLWALWLGWIALQIVPLPMATVQHYSPAAAQMQQALGPLALNPGLATLSIDRGRTAMQLILSGGYFSLYLLVLLCVNSPKRINWLLWTLTIAGLCQAFYGMHMTISGLEYGFFEKKKYGIGVATGTFVNRNHFAAYMELCLAAGTALVLADLGRWKGGGWKALVATVIDTLLSAKFRARVMLVVMAAALILTRSRMGSVAFFAALAACGMIFVLLRYRNFLLPSLIFFSSLVIIDLWVVQQYFGLDEVVERIENTDLETEGRTLVFADLKPLVESYKMTGSGLGSFAEAYMPFRNPEISGYYDHAHNEYLEFAIETGFVGCALLGLLLLTHIVHAVRTMARRKTPVYASAAFASLMAMAAMIAHSTAEFMLHIPAVAASLVALMALGMGVQSKSRARRRNSSEMEDTQETEAWGSAGTADERRASA